MDYIDGPLSHYLVEGATARRILARGRIQLNNSTLAFLYGTPLAA